MEGQPDVLDFPRRFQILNKLERAPFLRLPVGRPAQAVKPVVVYIVHAQPLQLTVEEGREIRSIPDHEQGQLIRNGIGHAGIPLDHSLTECHLAVALVVGGGGVKVGKAVFHELIHHFLDPLHIDAAVIVLIQQRQAHQTKAQLFPDGNLPFFFDYNNIIKDFRLREKYGYVTIV